MNPELELWLLDESACKCSLLHSIRLINIMLVCSVKNISEKIHFSHCQKTPLKFESVIYLQVAFELSL